MTTALKLGGALVAAVALAGALWHRTSTPGAAPHRWEPEIRHFEQRDREQPPSPGAVLFIGSSSITLWERLSEDFPGVKVLNRGFGGSSIEDTTYFAGRIVIAYRPRMVVLYAGENDLFYGKSPARVFEDFRAFVARVRADLPRVRIAFISMKPSPARGHLLDRMKAGNRRIRDFIAREPGLLYIDVFTPMLTATGQVREELFVENRLHLNAAGYALWRAVVAPYLASERLSDQVDDTPRLRK